MRLSFGVGGRISAYLGDTRMDRETLVSRILDDEGLIGGLNEADAQTLVGWLVRRAEQLMAQAESEATARTQIEALCRRGRNIARYVTALCEDHDLDVVAMLATSEGFALPASGARTAQSAKILQDLLDREGANAPGSPRS